jgi:site-specific DNA-methyltransferase (adenine-specific)
MLELDKIYCGDNCDLLGQLPRECIDLVVTSPPYDDLRTYGGHSWDFFGVAWQLKRVLKPGGVIVWVVADATKNGSETGSSMEQALHFKRLGLNLHDTMIYMKDSVQFPDANRYGQIWEYVFVFSASAPKTKNMICDRKNVSFGRTVTGTERQADGTTKKAACFGNYIKEFGQRFNVWQYATTKGNAETAHPAPFPQKLASDHIATWSNPGDLVLDPFSGSGTTAKAAKELGRRFLGLEINPEYCAIAERRIAQETLGLEAL